jgi:hypothetical protein
MIKFYTTAILLFAILASEKLAAQQFMGIKLKTPTVCYAHHTDNPCYIPPPEAYLNRQFSRTKSSTIEIIYNPGFTEEAKEAFQYAIEIWESLIVSTVPIRIDAYWLPLNPGVLGGALYSSAYANFSGAQKLNVFYPVPLAEKITGRNLNGNDPDIFIQFNNGANWNFNPAAAPGPGQFDLVSVVLHEIAHGLGFAGTFSVSGGTGTVGLQGSGVPIIYDLPIENSSAFNLYRTFSSPSSELGIELTSSNLFFRSATSTNPKLFAPSPFNGGSSISHLDETTYNNSGNSLMTPFIAPAEKIHDPGIAWNMLKDLGWEMTRIIHTPLTDSENVNQPFTVTAKILADKSYNPSSVTLNYRTSAEDFTTVIMSPTANSDEFSGIIPATGAPGTYQYYISVNDDAGREFVNPGKISRAQNTEVQFTFNFQTGPDVKPPIITHNQRLFLLDSETELELEARVTDNIGIDFVQVDYVINDIPKGTMPMILQAPEIDSLYRVKINLGPLANGDVIEYRIIAQDVAAARNLATAPQDGFFVLNVVGLEPTRDKYANNFNSATSDFFGNGFSITQPAGFTDGAIHSMHPYPEGNGSPNNELNLIYQLKIPIRVSERDGSIRFDEIVLVEPGEPGTVFGNLEFWDYVVVEGSVDGGITWTPVADGYDARDYSPWLTRYNSAISGNNSTAIGDPTLYRQRTMNMLNKFSAGDEVVIRFRLYSDPLAAGWGWAIDNLKIQIDDAPPTLQHNHANYIVSGRDALTLTATASDASGIEHLNIEYRINNGDIQQANFVVFPPAAEYNFTLTGLNALPVGTLLEYRFNATDSAGNSATLPPAPVEFFQVPVNSFGTPVTTYANNFDSPSNDFVGNFFSIGQPTGFTNGAIHSAHFYPLGFGTNGTSSFSYTLKKPVIISGSNPYMRFDEVVIVEGHPLGTNFGSPNFKDYVIVEGSKDGGATWSPFLEGYDLLGGEPIWGITFVNRGIGNASMYRTRIINLIANGNFQAGNQVIIRFRLFSDATLNGWGWTIDNLFIQDPVTGLPEMPGEKISLYPNPLNNQRLMIEAESLPSSDYTISIINGQGWEVLATSQSTSSGTLRLELNLSDTSAGVLLVRLSGNRGDTIIRKIIKTE